MERGNATLLPCMQSMSHVAGKASEPMEPRSPYLLWLLHAKFEMAPWAVSMMMLIQTASLRARSSVWGRKG